MSDCPAVNHETGARCKLPTGHPPPHQPTDPEPPAPGADQPAATTGSYHKDQARKQAQAARLREVDKSVAAGRRNNKRDETPAGTYPIRPPKTYRCIYDCDAPALLYPCGPRCDDHSPAAARAAREAAQEDQ